jgi:hypothetical protein
MVFSILSIAPASAVQIGSVSQFNINGITSKNLENNNTALDNNSTNQTAINETKINKTNGTGINATFNNDRNGTGINATFNNDSNKIEDGLDIKNGVLTTLNSIAGVATIFTGFALGIGTLFLAIPEPTTATKWIGGICIATAAVSGIVAASCYIASIFCSWFL